MVVDKNKTHGYMPIVWKKRQANENKQKENEFNVGGGVSIFCINSRTGRNARGSGNKGNKETCINWDDPK